MTNQQGAAPVVTISGSFAAGGGTVGPAVAERLGVPFMDRAIPLQVAKLLDVSVEEALDRDERRPPAIARFLASLAASGDALGAPAAPAERVANDDAFRVETEKVIRELARTGGVVLGRAGAVVLRDHPHALHVRLDAPRKQRQARIVEWEHISADAAGRLMDSTDRAWLSYVRYFYKADARDPSLYHLLMNSIELSLDACTDLVVTAALDRASAGKGD